MGVAVVVIGVRRHVIPSASVACSHLVRVRPCIHYITRVEPLRNRTGGVPQHVDTRQIGSNVRDVPPRAPRRPRLPAARGAPGAARTRETAAPGSERNAATVREEPSFRFALTLRYIPEIDSALATSLC